jgi:molecular chaperone GrpE
MTIENNTPETENDEAVAEEAVEQKDEKTKDTKKNKKENKKIEELESEIAKLKEELEAANDKYLRMYAEYENFRRRSQSEKDGIYSDACSDTITAILPVIDNLEMALKYTSDAENVVKGVDMTLTQFKDCLSSLGVTEIECKTFDPNFHNAVFHVEDENYGEGEIVEVFCKGYKKGNKIIRYAMVKVAN